MRIVVTGASGNMGSAVLRALGEEDAVDSIVGLARREPSTPLPKIEWRAADVLDAPLEEHFAGADAVVHLAWLIQPARDRAQTRAVNVEGSRRVFRAAAAAGVGALLHASSVGAYSPHPGNQRVDESWGTQGIPTSFYSRDKAAAERELDAVESAHGDRLRVVRLRPGIVVQREAAAEQRRLFLGPFVPGSLLRPALLPVLPLPAALRLQAVHAHDLADAWRRVITSPDAHGAYNVAAEPVLDGHGFARALGSRYVPVPTAPVRALAAATYAARLQPTEAGWLDLGTQAPLMDCSRIRDELGWTPRRDGVEALEDVLAGLREDAGADTPPLHPRAGGRARVREVLSGLGARRGF